MLIALAAKDVEPLLAALQAKRVVGAVVVAPVVVEGDGHILKYDSIGCAIRFGWKALFGRGWRCCHGFSGNRKSPSGI